jgi:hypothetical protein
MTFTDSFFGALVTGKIWNNQENPPKYYTNDGKRLHHYHIGLGGLLLSGILYYYGNNKERNLAKNIAGFSAGLVADDFQDLKSDLTKYRVQ